MSRSSQLPTFSMKMETRSSPEMFLLICQSTQSHITEGRLQVLSLPYEPQISLTDDLWNLLVRHSISFWHKPFSGMNHITRLSNLYLFVCVCVCVCIGVFRSREISAKSLATDFTVRVRFSARAWQFIFETTPRQSNAHYPTPKTLTEDFFICQLIPVHILSHCFFGIDFNIIIKFMYSSPTPL